MKRNNHSQRGQALIIIAFAIIGLVAMAALAIDGGSVYLDHRKAQNAADTAALATGLAVIRNQSWTDAQSIGVARAAQYGYSNTSPNSVNVYQCTDSGSSCGSYANNSNYMQVIITSHVKTYFAGIIGFPELVNKVSAIVLAVPPVNSPLFNGNAIVGLNKTACSAFNYQGGAGLTVNDTNGSTSGIFVNSNCNSSSNGAFNTNSGSASVTTPCLNVVGSITTGTNTTLNDNNCQPTTSQLIDPLSTYPQPNVQCGDSPATPTTSTDSQGTTWTHIKPGSYSGSFPPNKVNGVNVGSNIIMDSGTYCIDAGNQSFSLTGGEKLNSDTGGVLIKMTSGNVSWTSGTFNLSAESSGYYKGLLLYLPDPGNCSNVKINAGGVSTFSGTILAACSNVSIEGGASASGYQNQVIADTVSLSGNSNIVINYDSGQQWVPPSPPILELAR
jgi:hypothetical protein